MENHALNNPDENSPQTPAIKSPYYLYESYYINSSFSKQPGNIEHCIECGAILSEISLKLYPENYRESVSSKKVPYTPGFGFHYIWLFVCSHCRWWYFREYFGDNEFGLDLDLITVGIKPTMDDRKSETFEPWLIALSDERLYEKAIALPPFMKELLQNCHFKHTK
jgi:hypothetical protein